MTTLRIPAEQPWHQGLATQPRGGAKTRSRRGAKPQPRRSALQRGWLWLQRALLGGALVLLLTLGVLPHLGLYRPVTVLSGSMRPTFAPGDMVMVVPEPVSAVRVGQVISYQVPVGIHQVETHRVVRILQGGAHPVVQTKGDANNYPDPWTARLEGATAWRLVAVVPHLGYLVNWLRSPAGRTAAIVVAPALLALLVLLELWGPAEQDAGKERRIRREPYAGPERRRALGVAGNVA
jgi:signal peptidase I